MVGNYKKLVSNGAKAVLFYTDTLCAFSYRKSGLRVSEPLCKYRQSEGLEKISERDSAEYLRNIAKWRVDAP